MLTDQRNTLFQIKVNSEPVDLSLEDSVQIACREGSDWVLIPWDKYLMAGSPICRKLTKRITTKSLEELGLINTSETIETSQILQTTLVICLDEPSYHFTEYITAVEGFLEFIQFADRYMLNIPYAVTKLEKTMWLVDILGRQKDIWRTNSVVLQNIEQKLFDVVKFTAVEHNADYPVGVITGPKYVTMKEIPKPKFLSSSDFIILCELLIQSQAGDFLAKLLAGLGTSIEYYDIIFSNPIVIKMLKYLPTFESTTFYAFRLMYLEELAMFHNKRGPGRFIMNLNGAAQLPYFNNAIGHSPYMCCVVKSTQSTNGLSLPAMIDGVRGVYNISDFTSRMKIFTGDIFKYIVWSDDKSKAALSGSLITACAIKTPFEHSFDTPDEYFNEYYPKRNIKCETKHSMVVMDSMINFVEEDDEDVEIRAEPENDAEDNVNHKIDYTDIDLMIECKWEDFDEAAESHFKNIKLAAGELFPRAELIMEYVKTENKHKYIIKGLPREIDIFHIDSIPHVIVKYHLGCVRAWFDGTNVWCFPSFVTAAMTSTNVDIRWTSNRKDVRDIVLKYFQRGFGTLLNHSDRRSLIEYVNTSEDWPHQHQERGWRRRREYRKPLFHDQERTMFNPSFSRVGIHAELATLKNCIKIPRVSSMTTKKCDFKDGYVILLPAACNSLSPYF